MLAAGLEGYVFKQANWIERAVLLAGGLLLVFPGWTTDLIGIGIVSPVALRQVMAVRATRQA